MGFSCNYAADNTEARDDEIFQYQTYQFIDLSIENCKWECEEKQVYAAAVLEPR